MRIAYDSKGGIGTPNSSQNSLDLLCGWDIEEDLTVPSGDTDLTAGSVDGTASNNMFPRSLYYAVGLINLDLTTPISVAYTSKLRTTATTYTSSKKTYPLQPGQEGRCMPLITLYGTSNGTTAGAKVKILYKERAIYDGTGPQATGL